MENLTKRQLYGKKRYLENRERLLAQSTAYHIKNRERVNKRKADKRRRDGLCIRPYRTRNRTAGIENIIVDGLTLEQSKKFSIYARAAKISKRDFSLNAEQFTALWKAPCHYCGTILDTIGIDRVDNSVGYIPSNVAACCEKCNRMKYTWKVDDFLSHVKKIYSHNFI